MARATGRVKRWVHAHRRSAVLLAIAVLSFVAASGGLAALLSRSAHPLPTHAPGTPCRVSGDQRASGTLPPVTRVSHIVVVMLENKECGEIVGNPAARYTNGLAQRFALALNSHAIRHPSEPNYLALTGGSTFGHRADCRSCLVRAPNLVDELEHAGISWKAYMGGLPAPCSTVGSAGPAPDEYVREIDPFLLYVDVLTNPGRCSHVVPLSELKSDLAKGTLPRFVWVTPNLCQSAHSCSIRTGDKFLSQLLPPLLRRLEHNGLLFVTWDEGDFASDRGCCRLAAGGNVAAIVAGGAARRGAVSTAPYDHYSVLRTIEDAWRLPELRDAACPCTRAMRDLIAPGVP